MTEKRGLEFGYQSRQTSTRGVGGLSFQALLMGGGNSNTTGSAPINSSASRSMSPIAGTAGKGGETAGVNVLPSLSESASPSRLPPIPLLEIEGGGLADGLIPSPLRAGGLEDDGRGEGTGVSLSKADDGQACYLQPASSSSAKIQAPALPSAVQAPPTSPDTSSKAPENAASNSNKSSSIVSATLRPAPIDIDDAALFKGFLGNKSISWLLTREFGDISFNDIFKPCWLYSCGYGCVCLVC
ncbi:hypothetical protein EON64_08585 [archaeon]|nr:MAG: hypothetical protein EON64_08585 [archaeon]